jgi:hypothetical protein
MKRAIVAGLLVAAVAAPAVLAADPAPADFKNAAKYCKALRESKGVEAFNTQYGTNTNKRNAFGKCVSSTNKANPQAAKKDDEKADDAAETKATAECKKQQAADAAKFAATYKNLGQCVKAQKKSDD